MAEPLPVRVGSTLTRRAAVVSAVVTIAVPTTAAPATTARPAETPGAYWLSTPAARKPTGPGAEMAMVTAVMTTGRSGAGVRAVSAAKKRGKYRPELTP